MSSMLFQGWENIWRTLLVGVLAYVGLVLLLRIAGKRTLTKLNAFDLVVTVALGSTLATILLNQDVALAEGITAFAILIAMQFAVTWTSVRMPWVRSFITGEPTLLAYQGEMLPDRLRQQRVSEVEVLAAVRNAGLRGVADAQAVVLETDGSISVLHQGSGAGELTLKAVNGAEERIASGSQRG